MISALNSSMLFFFTYPINILLYVYIWVCFPPQYTSQYGFYHSMCVYVSVMKVTTGKKNWLLVLQIYIEMHYINVWPNAENFVTEILVTRTYSLML